MTALWDVGPVCIECGCTEFSACVSDEGEPCHWLLLHDDHGVCSSCPQAAERFEEGDRTLSNRAHWMKRHGRV